MKKNIWIINQYNMPPELGHLNRHYYFAKELKKIGYNPVVFVGSYLHNTSIQMIENKDKYKKYDNAEFDYIFVKTINYKGSILRRIFAMLQFSINLIKISKKFNKPDIILGSSAHPLNAYLALKLSRKYKIPNIVEVRDLWPESFVAYNIIKRNNILLKVLYHFEKKIYEKANKLIFTMEGGRQYIIDKKWDIDSGGKIELSKVNHINNGINLAEFLYKIKNYVIDDSDLKDNNTFKIIYVGSIRRVNKIHKLLEIAMELKNYLNIVFLIYGDGDEKNNLANKAKELNLNNIKFKGRVQKKYIPFILSNSDLNMIIGENNTLFKYGISANKIFDYFASNKPTLQTFKTDYSIIRRYNAGVEVETFDAKKISDIILDFYNMDVETYNKFKIGAANAAIEYDYENLVKKLDKIIKEG